MSAEESKALVRRFLDEALNQANVDAGATLLSGDFVVHFGGLPEPFHGVEAWKQLAVGFFAAFPDLHITVDDMFADGNQVAVRYTAGGTHKGPFQGIPATGKSFTMTGMGIYRIADGQIVEEWLQDDMLGLLQQLDVIPAPGQAA
jgi:steroid delta-isomerase-like uncharacterized protein